MFKQFLKIFIVFLCSAGLVTVADSYVASSTNYVMQTDSVNFAGNISTSSSFSLSDTLGEAGTGAGVSDSFNLNAGYQAMQVDTYLDITAPDNATMTPAINGLAGGTSAGSAAWTVTTNNAGGYQVYIRADADPALHDGAGHSFADYAPSYANPDFSWNTPSAGSRFGFSPEGAGTVAEYLDDGSACGAGASNTADACWNGFTTLNELIVSSASANAPGGTVTTVKFQAAVGANHIQEQGEYSANIIVSVVTN